MDLELAKVLYEQHLVFDQSVVDAAVQALQEGRDSPSLRLLAGLGPNELIRTRELLERTSRELLLPSGDDLTGVLVAGSWLAGEALEGRVEMRKAVQWIAYETWAAYREAPDFEPLPEDRPTEVQKRVNAMMLADVLDYEDRLPKRRRAEVAEQTQAFLRDVARWS